MASRKHLIIVGLLAMGSTGCNHIQRARMAYQSPTVRTLGTSVDPYFETQEAAGEASDFVIYQHEFANDTHRLNTAGEDHVRQIAARMNNGQDFQVVIERGFTTPRQETEYQYPIHPNPQLDERRRTVVAKSLELFGVHDANSRVVVAPAFAEGYEAPEAANAYQRSFFGGFGGGGGLGNSGGFGGGGIGGFGGFGGSGGFF